MAHEIDRYVGANVPAWHNLGETFDRALTVTEARAKAFPWEPVDHSLTLADGTPVTSHKAILRSDNQKQLGIVGAKFESVGNGEAFQWMEELLDSNELQIETAGSLDSGRRVWMLARLNESIDLPGNDQINPYLLVANGHDGSLALSATPTTVRVVCQNTLSLALSRQRRTRGESRGFILRHNSTVRQRMLDATATMAAARASFEHFEARARKLAETAIKRDRAREFFTSAMTGPLGILPPDLETVPVAAPIVRPAPLAAPAVDLWGMAAAPIVHAAPVEIVAPAESSPAQERFASMLADIVGRYDQEHATGSAWGAFNAVTEQIDHGRRYRSAESRFHSSLLGEAAQQKQQIFELAVRTFA